jgi:hypothetical protein
MSAALFPADYGSVPMGGHCGVLATAIFAGRTFQEAWDALAPYQPPRRGGWKGGTRHDQRKRVLEGWNVPHTVRTHITNTDMIVSGLSPRTLEAVGILPRCSVATFARRHAKPGTLYMLRVGRHVVTLRDGIVMDQTGAAPAAEHRSGRAIVTVSTERL